MRLEFRRAPVHRLLMEMVTIYTAFNPADAQLVRSRLDAADIPVYVAHELSAMSIEGYALSAGGIDVKVPESFAALAREIIGPASESASE